MRQLTDRDLHAAGWTYALRGSDGELLAVTCDRSEAEQWGRGKRGVVKKTDPGNPARWCTGAAGWCGCRDRRIMCTIRLNRDAKVAMSMLSIEERQRWSREKGVAEYEDFCLSPYYGIPGIVTRHRGKWYMKKTIHSSPPDAPPSASPSIWQEVPELNMRYAIDLPVIPRPSPAVRAFRRRMAEIRARQ